MYLIGYDIGSSSIKAALLDAESGKTLALTKYPDKELEIIASHPGWAEQDPELWWGNLGVATKRLFEEVSIDCSLIKGIGISYQMHGLVIVDDQQKPLRPSIIWCDSRAVNIGNKAFEEIGEEKCLKQLLNSPGNFTASKLGWVKENEPEIFNRIHKIMLPGDYIGMKMTGEISTTITGMSEGMLWDFEANDLSESVLEYFGFDRSLFPKINTSLSLQGRLTKEAAEFLGLVEGIPLTYRAGDQPNNAISLNTLHNGEVAATGGTSGVVYGVVDHSVYDEEQRVNLFAHVNHTPDDPHIGVLLCVNGTGIQYSWLREMMANDNVPYNELEVLAASVDIGAEGLSILPFGNGAERMLSNNDIGCQIMGLNFNLHKQPHMYRAALEGIAFSFIYGIELMNKMGVEISVIKVGNDNLFQSNIFSTTIASILNCEIQMMNTTGAIGAAKAAGVASGVYPSLEMAFQNLELVHTYQPEINQKYQLAYQKWRDKLNLLTK